MLKAWLALQHTCQHKTLTRAARNSRFKRATTRFLVLGDSLTRRTRALGPSEPKIRTTGIKDHLKRLRRRPHSQASGITGIVSNIGHLYTSLRRLTLLELPFSIASDEISLHLHDLFLGQVTSILSLEVERFGSKPLLPDFQIRVCPSCVICMVVNQGYRWPANRWYRRCWCRCGRYKGRSQRQCEC
jgi:hypothetical protein